MKTWIIEPRDPFIARDGKPFTAIPGSRATSLPFPFPSTTTGGVRTRAGLRDEVFDTTIKTLPETLKRQITVRGPLLVRLDDRGRVFEWFFPAPQDALLFAVRDESEKGQACLRQLHPEALSESKLTNLPKDLWPVYLRPKTERRKPYGNPPRFWRWKVFERWLNDPSELADREHAVDDGGHFGPTQESRTHVKVDSPNQTAAEGALFQTRGLEFTWCDRDTVGRPKLAVAHRLAFAVNTNADELNLESAKLDPFSDGLSTLGGERRIVTWRSGPVSDVFSSECSTQQHKEIHQSILTTRRCRLILLTPAYFSNGLTPTWLLENASSGVQAQIRAIANSRYQVVSGWDFECRQAKPTCRLVPAGSVFWIELPKQDKADNASIESWIRAIWMRSVSDDEQHRWDGFGLAVLGAWKDAPANATEECK